MLYLLKEYPNALCLEEIERELEVGLWTADSYGLIELVTLFLLFNKFLHGFLRCTSDAKSFKLVVFSFHKFTFLLILLHQQRILLLGLESAHIRRSRAGKAQKGHDLTISYIQYILEPIDLNFFASLIFIWRVLGQLLKLILYLSLLFTSFLMLILGLAFMKLIRDL